MKNKQSYKYNTQTVRKLFFLFFSFKNAAIKMFTVLLCGMIQLEVM